MTLQVINTKLDSFNQMRSTKETLFQDIKTRRWDIKDCKVIELKEELIHTLYRSADGKNTARY